MPKREKTGKEVTFYCGIKNLGFVDNLVTAGQYKSRSAALDSIVTSVRVQAERQEALTSGS